MTATVQSLAFCRLWLPRPLDPDRVQQFLERLAADPRSPWLILETRATASGITHLAAVHPPQVPWLHQTLRDLLPGVEVSSQQTVVDRPPCQAAAEITFVPDAIALSSDNPVAVTTAVLSALNHRLAHGETLVAQFQLGPRRTGHHVPAGADDPHQGTWSRLIRGTRPATRSSHKQLEGRQAHHGFVAAVRIGATTMNPTRQRQLLSSLAGALATARSTGIHLRARRIPARRINAAAPPQRWRQHLTPAELTGLIAWPIGEGELPGVPPIHPRLLLPTTAPIERDRAFGVTALPGTERPVGISPRDALLHMIALGPTGSGKSNALLHLIRADIAAGRPLLVIDPKKQLIDDIIATCVPSERIDDVVVFDVTASARNELTVGFNPLDVGDRNPDVVVDGLLAVFKAVFHDGWGPRTEDIFLSSWLTLARAGQHRSLPYTLLDLPMLLTDATFRRCVLAQARPDQVLAGFWAAYDDMTPAAQSAMIAAPMNKLRRYLLRPAARAILGQPVPRFRLRDIFRQNKIVLVALNDALIGEVTAELIGSLIVAVVWEAAQERAAETLPMERPGYVIVDECQRFLHLPTSLGDALGQSRSYGVGWILAHQSRMQLPADLVEAIDSNGRNKLVFRLESAKDAAAMAKLAIRLDPEDFQLLPKHHAYARVMVDGESSGWHAIKTNPPPQATGLAETIRRRSREIYGDTPPPDGGESASGSPQRSIQADAPVGRKKRVKADSAGAVSEEEADT